MSSGQEFVAFPREKAGSPDQLASERAAALLAVSSMLGNEQHMLNKPSVNRDAHPATSRADRLMRPVEMLSGARPCIWAGGSGLGSAYSGPVTL